MTELNAVQKDLVRLYFKTLADIRGQEFLEPCDELLSLSTHSYCDIQLLAGGDPVLLAKQVMGLEPLKVL